MLLTPIMILHPASPYPQVKATSTSTGASGTAHTVTLPSGIQSGDLLIAVVVCYDDRSHTWPVGWTEIWDNDTGNMSSSGAYRVADGSEGSSISVTTSLTTTTAHVCYRIGNYQGTPEAGIAVESTSTTPNPPSLDPAGWGSDDMLMLAFAGTRDTGVASAAPSGYTNLIAHAAGSPGPSAMSARREITASSDDPGGFTIPATATWTAQTVAIRGA